MGARAYTVIEQYSDSLQVDTCVVEVGSERGEGSTQFLADFCGARGTPFYTVDIDEEAFGRAARIPCATAWHGTGERFLEEVFPAFGLTIAFAYLDSFDWIWSWAKDAEWIQDQVERYRNFGLAMTNVNSQVAHLHQAQLVARYAARDCLILFDDTWQRPGAGFDGKGGAAVPWLLQNGYALVGQPSVGEERSDGFVLVRKRL